MNDPININWKEQTFRSLREVSHSSTSDPGSGEREQTLQDRYREVVEIVRSDRIVPETVSPWRDNFAVALCEVLSRLPQDAFNKVESGIGYVLEDPALEMAAINVAAPPSPRKGVKLGVDNIVFFRASLALPTAALVGLIAHELAHSFVHGRDYLDDEAKVNAFAREWGFGPELESWNRAKLEFKARPATCPPDASV